MKRRTQADRREQAIRRLLDATTESLIEVGYAHTSAAEICKRAGLSTGGLFRHFPSVEALMVAAADDVGKKILARYRERFQRSEPSLALALKLVRESCRSRLNQAWYELAIAARTNPRLKKAITPLAAAYYDAIAKLSRELLPDLAAALPAHFDVIAETVVAIFDGEQLHRLLVKDSGSDNARVTLLLTLIESLLSRPIRP